MSRFAIFAFSRRLECGVGRLYERSEAAARRSGTLRWWAKHRNISCEPLRPPTDVTKSAFSPFCKKSEKITFSDHESTTFACLLEPLGGVALP